MKKLMNNKNGITLIALIITIIILIILASISIGMVMNNNGILGRATSSKTETEIGEEKEIISLSSMQLASKETVEDKDRLSLAEMEAIVENNARGLEFELLEDDDGYIVEFKKRRRYYKIYDNGETEEVEIVKDTEAGDITKDKNGNDLDGTTKPYEIWNIEDLIAFTKTINNYEGKTIKLMRNLDFNSNLSYDNPKTTEYDEYLGGDGTTGLKAQLLEGGLGFKLTNVSFKGTFDGQNNKISNLYTDLENGNMLAFFGVSNYGTIENVKFYNINVKTNCKSGLICSLNKGAVENISITGKIIAANTSAGGYSVGSICEFNEGTIKKVYNYANVEGISSSYFYLGGICYTNRAIIEQCVNNGTISKGKRLGGIACTNTGTIRQCINNGKVQPVEDGGGITNTNSGTIEYCYNINDVGIEGGNYSSMSGITKTNDTSGIVTNCYSIGVINGNRKAGISYENKGSVLNSYYIKKGIYDLQSSSSTGTVENSSDKTEAQMKNDSFLNDLNAGLTTGNEIFVKDTNNINGGFPILKWQLTN